MRDIKDYLVNEAYKLSVGIVISGSGSTNGEAIEFVKRNLLKNYPNAALFQYDTSQDKVYQLESIDDWEVTGPHGKLVGLGKWFTEHSGEYIFLFVQG